MALAFVAIDFIAVDFRRGGPPDTLAAKNAMAQHQ
jgi:hypothetical protein